MTTSQIVIPYPAWDALFKLNSIATNLKNCIENLDIPSGIPRNIKIHDSAMITGSDTGRDRLTITYWFPTKGYTTVEIAEHIEKDLLEDSGRTHWFITAIKAKWNTAEGKKTLQITEENMDIWMDSLIIDIPPKQKTLIKKMIRSA